MACFLGKTVQTIIAIVLKMYQSLQSCNVIICPSTLLINWKDEIKKWAPFLKVELLDTKTLKDKNVFDKKLLENNIMLINYEKINYLT